MRILETSLPGVMVIEPHVFGDERGFFMETYHANRLESAGIYGNFVQDNHSQSVRDTLRGLHYQLKSPQAKLCRVVQGEVFDVAVDIRRGSPTYGQWTAVVLSAENRRQLYIPRGFAHGFLVLSDTAEFLYKCDAFYMPGDEYGIAWNDPELGIQWPLTAAPLLSQKDGENPSLDEAMAQQLPIWTPSLRCEPSTSYSVGAVS